MARGGYILSDSDQHPELILIATGSEVTLAQQAADEFRSQGRAVRVVSMPSPEQFEAQDALYKESVLPSDVLARVAIEALHQDFWFKYVGLDGRIIGMNSFGESAPAAALYEHFDITVGAVLACAEELLD